MATLTESIETDVPLEFADREWNTYVVRQFYEGQSRLPSEVSDEFKDGTVGFEPVGGRLTRVTVDLEMEPAPGTDPEIEYSHARESVESVLEGYRSYVLRRCAQTHCR
jgi:hypothetical protein